MSNLNSNQFHNVFDLGASRNIKKSTGQTIPVRYSGAEDSPSLTKHEDEALAQHKPAPVKKSLLRKTTEYLGLSE